MDLKEIKPEKMDCIQLTQGRVQWKNLVDTVMSLQIP
jgi:hypothetical protein